MQQAQGALDAARAAGADKYATDEYEAAQLALTHSREAVDARDYRLALSHALDSRERAQSAAKMAADGMATARVEADRALTAAENAVAQAATRLEAARTAKVPARLLTAPAAAIDTARTGVQEARAQFDRGDYLSVPSRAAAATAAIPATLRDLDAAAAPPPRRRR